MLSCFKAAVFSEFVWGDFQGHLLTHPANLSRRYSVTSTMAAALFTRVIARTEAEFAAGLAAHSTSGKLFFLFTGAKVAETGQSWCPDCVDAAPVSEDK